VHSALGIDASCTNINIIKCIDPILYGYEDDGFFIQWLLKNPYEEAKVTIHFIEAIELFDMDDGCLQLTTLVDDISMENVYGFDINGIQTRI
jgi:hypothetical protein